jgi:hypothetical protein
MDFVRVTRRDFVKGAAALGVGLLVPRGARAKGVPEAARKALAESRLVYVSPLLASGAESTCHGEVWFVEDGTDVLVVTGSDRWKAKAIASGRSGARLWVGDFGVWKEADGKYLSAPSFDAKASVVTDALVHERVLASFGKKYPDEWGKWGPRFKDGLADESRVMIRYAPREA